MYLGIELPLNAQSAEEVEHWCGETKAYLCQDHLDADARATLSHMLKQAEELAQEF